LHRGGARYRLQTIAGRILWFHGDQHGALKADGVNGNADLLQGVDRGGQSPDAFGFAPVRDETDAARAQEYGLLGSLLLNAPDAATLTRLSHLQGTATPIGLAHIRLAEAAGAASPEAVKREHLDLFIGVARGELVPYASYYLTGFLNDRPLARLRQDLGRLALERAEGHFDPEDHLGTLCEIMSGFADGRFEVSAEEERGFFGRHIAPWAHRFFCDLESAKSARFYAAVGTVGRLFMEIEAEAFAMDGAVRPG
jgi:TorA maturation chaperone TorD